MKVLKQRKLLNTSKKIALIGDFDLSAFPISKQNFLNFFQQEKIEVLTAKGYQDESYIDEALLNEAQRKAQASDVAMLLLFAPQQANKIPFPQHQLIRSVNLLQSKLVVLLFAEQEVETPWLKYTHSSLQIDQNSQLEEIMGTIFYSDKTEPKIP